MDRNFVNRAKDFSKDLFRRKQILVRYMKDSNGIPFGVVVGVNTSGGVLVGHSRCNMKKDNFNKYVGVYIAVERALKENYAVELDSQLSEWYTKMVERGEKYWNLRGSLVEATV